jgi:hypothetical protein
LVITIALAALLAMVAFATVARADSTAEVEPNDHLLQATGTSGIGPFVGSLANAEDQDIFSTWLYDTRPTDIAFTVNDGGCARATLKDRDNRTQISTVVSNGNGDTQHIQFMPDGVDPGNGDSFTEYYLTVSHAGCDTASYEFTISSADGATSFTRAPDLSAYMPETEPDDSTAQALGPLTFLSAYTGTIDTASDEDWMHFYTPPGGVGVIDVYGSTPDACGDIHVQVMRDGGSPTDPDAAAFSTGEDAVGHAVLTSGDAARYNVKITGSCARQGWWLNHSPNLFVPGLPVWFATPPDPQRVLACQYANANIEKVRGRLRAARKAAQRATGRRARRLALHRRDVALRRYTAAQHHRSKVCGP